MQIRNSIIAAGVAGLALAGLGATAYLAGPGIYAKHILKKGHIELSSKEFVDSACREDTGTVLLMLAAGMDVNTKAPDEHRNNIQTTALYCAASKGNTKLIGLLIDHGAALEAANPINETALMAAVSSAPRIYQNNFDAVTALLDRGAQVNAKSDNGTVLHIACRTGNMKLVNLLLDRGANPALADGKGAPPLNSCAVNMYNSSDIPFDRLLVKGVDINATSQDGTTLLSRAVQSGNIKLVDKLLSLGASPNTTDGTGDTPLIYAVRNMEMLNMLVDKGANVNQPGKNGTPLAAALRFQSMSAVGYLLSKGADPKVADVQGNTPLHYAAQFAASAQAIKMLVANGALPNVANLEGNTPLHLAARNHISTAVNDLLASGANPNARNFAGQTPLTMERSGGGFPSQISTLAIPALNRPSVPLPQGGPASDIAKTLIKHGAKM
jgi:ankyrin repeat protein